ncbi:MAG: hypothetical protein ACO245_07410, partial [Ilumatobacteraceae bacterium]
MTAVAKKYGVSANVVKGARNSNGRINFNQILLKKYGANPTYLQNYKLARKNEPLSETKLERNRAFSKFLGETNTRFFNRKERDETHLKMESAKTDEYSKKYGTTEEQTVDVLTRLMQNVPRQNGKKRLWSDFYTDVAFQKKVDDVFAKLRQDTKKIRGLKNLSNASKQAFINRLVKGENVVKNATMGEKVAKTRKIAPAAEVAQNNINKYTRVAELTPEKRAETEKTLKNMGLSVRNVTALMKKVNKGENVMNEARKIQASVAEARNAPLKKLKEEVTRQYKDPNIIKKIQNASTINEVRKLKSNNPSTANKIGALKYLSRGRKTQYVKQLNTMNFKNVLLRAVGEDAMTSLKNKSMANSVRKAIMNVPYGPDFEKRIRNIVNDANKGEEPVTIEKVSRTEMTESNRGVRSKLNSNYYNKLTKAERDAFFKRWMTAKDTSIWAEARKIQAERSK